MDILGWIVIGGLAGWIASIITKNNARMGLLANIVVGVAGGFIGGFLIKLLGGKGISGFNFWSLFVAILGSTVLLIVINLMRGKRR